MLWAKKSCKILQDPPFSTVSQAFQTPLVIVVSQVINPAEVPPTADPWIVWTYSDATGHEIAGMGSTCGSHHKKCHLNEIFMESWWNL